MENRNVKLILVSGAPGAGKSTLSAKLVATFGLVWLDKDAIDEPFSPGRRDHHYNREIEPKVLEALFNLARINLSVGQSVLIDLPWTHILLNEPRWVARVRETAASTGAGLIVLECRLSEESLRQRMAKRGLDRDQVKLTDEGWSAFRTRDRLGEKNPLPHHVINAEEPPDACYAQARQFLAEYF